MSAADADPAREAAHILASTEEKGLYRLRFWRGSWWYHSAGRYQEKPSEETRAQVVNALNERLYDLKSRNVSDVVEHLRAKSILPSAIEPAAWLDKAPNGWPADECLATKNEIVHLPSLVEQREVYSYPASPAFFTTSATDFPLDLNAPRPDNFLAFLAAIWGDDPQSIQTLQEIIGYMLTPDTRQQKIFLLVGPKRSGKGTIARVVRGLVGDGNIAAPTLSSLATNFGLSPLIGKSVAIISDARLSGRPDQAVVVERLLSISGEDAQTIDRKHQSAVTCKLPTRFVVLSNELPRLNDASGAVVSRMILLHTTKSFYGQEDHSLTDKLLAERESILLWAIQGWQRLRERGRFMQPDTALESLAEMNDLASPVSAFIRDCCFIGPGEVVPVADLFSAWKRWCETQGREKYRGTIQTFARDLLAAEPTIRRKRVREYGDRVRCYEGIGLREGF